MKNKLKEKCILITGASSGMGRALATKLSESGNFIIASGRSEQKLNDLALAAGGKVRVLTMDVADKNSVKEATDKLHSITDYLDMVICCAGVCEYEDKLDLNPEKYEKTLDVNFLGLVRTVNLALPLLKKSETLKPQVVMVGSLSSLVGFPRAEAYGASKAAVQYFAESLMGDAAKLPLSVTLVRPGFVSTSMTENNDFPMPFMISADSAAERIIAGLESGKRFIDFPSRLSFPLIAMSKFKSIWLNFVAPRLSRHSSQSW